MVTLPIRLLAVILTRGAAAAQLPLLRADY